MADNKISAYPASSGLSLTDIFPVVDDPSGTPATQKATFTQLATLLFGGNVASLSLTAATNQIILDSDTANTGSITMATLSAARTWTFPNSTGTICLVANTTTLQGKTMDTSCFFPVLAGGSGTTSTLTLQPTSGVGTTGADIIFKVGNNGATEAMRILNDTSIAIPLTITAPGTTGAQTINKMAGRVNIAAAGTSVVVTNSLVTANSIIMAVAATNDTSARVTNVVPAAGSFTIRTVAVTAETAFSFLVIN